MLRRNTNLDATQPGRCFFRSLTSCWLAGVAVRGHIPRAHMIVKKYSNRRLYDTVESRYITVDELAQKIRRGVDATVVDAKTNEDLTQATLTQIILESRGGAKLLPVPLLQQLIRMENEALAEFFGRYMTWALEIYMRARSQAQAISPYVPLATVPFSATNALARMMMGSSPWGNAEPPPQQQQQPPPPPPIQQSSYAAEDVAELRRELEKLKRSVNKGKSNKKS